MKEPIELAVRRPEDMKGELRDVGGSQSDGWNQAIAGQLINTLWTEHLDRAEADRLRAAAVEALVGIGPRDELEGMLGAQLIACHAAAMECYRRAMHSEQTFEGRRENLSQANKLSRAYATLLETLNRHRGKSQQKVTVEHVHVHPGGQVVVGVVETPGVGERPKSADQAHAKQIAHASEPALLRPNEGRDVVSIAGDAERTMPNARRRLDWGTQGQS